MKGSSVKIILIHIRMKIEDAKVWTFLTELKCFFFLKLVSALLNTLVFLFFHACCLFIRTTFIPNLKENLALKKSYVSSKTGPDLKNFRRCAISFGAKMGSSDSVFENDFFR